MKIIIDESVSYGVVSYLREAGYDVMAIAESNIACFTDTQVFDLVKGEKAVLITRDHHFTNSLRYPPNETANIIFIRKGNLTSQEEIELLDWFLNNYSFHQFKGRLITLSQGRAKIR